MVEGSKREEENEGIGAYKKKKKVKGSLMELGLPRESRRGWSGL